MRLRRAWVLPLVIALLLGGVGLAWVATNLDRLVKSGIETYGPRVLGVGVEVDAVHLLPLIGTGHLYGLRVKNPPHFQEEYLAKVGAISVSLALGSLTSQTVRIRSVIIRRPEVDWEGGFRDNNLTRLRAMAGKGGSSPARRFVIEKFRLEQARATVHFQGLGAFELALPDIELTHLGEKGQGATMEEIAGTILDRLESEMLRGIHQAPQVLGGAAKALGEGLREGTSGITKGLKSLFGK